MTTRTRARKQTITGAPFVEAVKPEAAKAEEFNREQFQEEVNDLLKGIPSWRRVLCASIASVATGWLATSVVMSVVTYLMVGAAFMTGSVFIVNVIYILGVLLAVYAGWRASGFGWMVVIDRKIDGAAERAYSTVKNLFSKEEVCHA